MQVSYFTGKLAFRLDNIGELQRTRENWHRVCLSSTSRHLFQESAAHMKVLVCGARTDANRVVLFDTLDRIAGRLGVTAVLQLGEPGAEELALEWADRRNFRIERMETAAPAFRKGSSEFPKKRKDAAYPDLVVAFSGETRSMELVCQAKTRGIAVIEMYDHQSSQQTTSLPAPQSGPRNRATGASVGRR